MPKKQNVNTFNSENLRLFPKKQQAFLRSFPCFINYHQSSIIRS